VVRLEGGDFDAGFREELFEVGRGYAAPRAPDMTDDEDSGGSDDDLRQARRRTETEGQRFRRHIMTRLFNSASSGAVRRPE
jgi:hypothetical protein